MSEVPLYARLGPYPRRTGGARRPINPLRFAREITHTFIKLFIPPHVPHIRRFLKVPRHQHPNHTCGGQWWSHSLQGYLAHKKTPFPHERGTPVGD